MAVETWTERHPFVRLVTAAPSDFEFFQLLHLIERLLPDAASIGQNGPAPAEPVRLRPALSLAFPAGDLSEARWLDHPGGRHLEITLTFLGLYGSDSPLPAHVTESLLAEQEEDERVRAFIDLFHHRIYSLLYRVWKKYRYYVTFKTAGDDPISQVVRGLLGIGTPKIDEQLAVHPMRLFRYVGLLTQRPRSATGLVGQLGDYFQGIDFQLEQCVARWVWIQPNDRNALGVEKCVLGGNFLLGERIHDRRGKFRVKLGPVGFDDYVRFLPTGTAAAELAQIVRFYCEDPLEHDVAVTLRGEEVPETPLGRAGVLGHLSQTTWLKSKPCDNKTIVFDAAILNPTNPPPPA
jgi:type VI secretion system protein ImpH